MKASLKSGSGKAGSRQALPPQQREGLSPDIAPSADTALWRTVPMKIWFRQNGVWRRMFRQMLFAVRRSGARQQPAARVVRQPRSMLPPPAGRLTFRCHTSRRRSSDEGSGGAARWSRRRAMPALPRHGARSKRGT